MSEELTADTRASDTTVMGSMPRRPRSELIVSAFAAVSEETTIALRLGSLTVGPYMSRMGTTSSSKDGSMLTTNSCTLRQRSLNDWIMCALALRVSIESCVMPTTSRRRQMRTATVNSLR